MAAFEAWLVFLILVVNVVGELQRKRTLAASRGFLAAARLSCLKMRVPTGISMQCCMNCESYRHSAPACDADIVLQTCMYTIAYNTIEEFLRGLKS